MYLSMARPYDHRIKWLKEQIFSFTKKYDIDILDFYQLSARVAEA